MLAFVSLPDTADQSVFVQITRCALKPENQIAAAGIQFFLMGLEQG